ncbi:MAG: response regulator [Acidobacteria bacterium]|jgi:FixJ family two-component response regulator|nr:response regulator [Acidobacteriota bacterium]
MDAEPRVYVVDDDLIVLRAIDRLLRSSGFTVQTFDSPSTFLGRLPYDGPACLVLDLRMPELSGLEVQERLALQTTSMPIVFFSGASDVSATATAMRRGAIDFLVKPVDDRTLVDTVARALDVAVERWRRRREQDELRGRLARLTKRERQVCDLVARGLLNKQIAHALGTSEATVKVHRGRVMKKLEVDSAAALVWLLSRAQEAPSR